MKLYFLYSIISNKTIRANEKYKKVFKKRNKKTLGELVKTNRGYFIDGHHVDLKSVSRWFEIDSNPVVAEETFKVWKNYLKSLEEKKKES